MSRAAARLLPRLAALALRLAALAAVTGVAATTACHTLTSNVVPVPPVHRAPPDVVGRTIAITADAAIETQDPTHVQRANLYRIPQNYRTAMVEALGLAGFRVTSDASSPHDLVATLALAVSEKNDEVRQTYRCRLVAPAARGGETVAQIDWTWPKGTYTDADQVLDFAAHNLATEVASSPQVVTWLRANAPPSP